MGERRGEIRGTVEKWLCGHGGVAVKYSVSVS